MSITSLTCCAWRARRLVALVCVYLVGIPQNVSGPRWPLRVPARLARLILAPLRTPYLLSHS